jgi:hypothetical protein
MEKEDGSILDSPWAGKYAIKWHYPLNQRMKLSLFPAVILAGLSLSFSVSAAVHYVDLNCGSPASPYTSWATAATNIQQAMLVSIPGDTVLVTNGIYQTGGYSSSGSNRVYLFNNVTVRSVNGPAFTTIKGYQVPGTTNGATAVRCAYLSSGAVLSGFTLTNGATTTTEYGGGIKCASTSAVVTNCVIIGNAAYYGGAGAYSGTLINCIITDNACGLPNALGWGGGASSGTLINCLLARNFTTYIGGGAYNSTLINCTVVSNTASSGAAGASYCVLSNSIVYHNSPDNGVGTWGSTYFSCDTFPMPFFGTGNITNPPALANPAGGDYHLSTVSPCVNAGSNAYVASSIDLDGNPRIVGGRVDMGAYEFQPFIRYVNLSNPAPVSPYTNWPTAATNIQDAIDVASADDVIVVSNGIYQTGGRAVYGSSTNRVVVDRAVTVQSVNGPDVTFIAGNRRNPEIRCVYLTNGAALIGFTLTNGSSLYAGDVWKEQSGGGVWCEVGSAIVSNCVFTGNAANQSGAGGGAFRGFLFNCLLTNNSASLGGGAGSNTLVNCILTRNVAFATGINSGGGAVYSTLSNCLLVGNRCNGGGGGAAFSLLTGCGVSNNAASQGGGVCLGVASACLISSNRASNLGGGAFSNSLDNCLVKNNYALAGAGGTYQSALVNCTVAGNTGQLGAGGGLYGGGATNCIVYYNLASQGGSNYWNSTMSFCDTVPLALSGVGNITNEPAFLNLPNGDFRLQSNSPCINAGNNAAVAAPADLDGNPRTIGGTVDLGAYECQSPALLDYYLWLQNYALPTDASLTYVDSDGDGANNREEYLADTSPIDANDYFHITGFTRDGTYNTLWWTGKSTRLYQVERRETLDGVTPWETIITNATPGWDNVGFDSTGQQYFYRIQAVQP